ncbi:hypothetical protein Tco_0595234 [Tanacetum coccineum]
MQTQEDHSTPIPALNVDSLKVDLVVIQDTCSEKEDSQTQQCKITVSRSGNDTDADDADIRPIYDEEPMADDADFRPIYDEEPMAEVQLTAECNIFAIGQQHTEQPKIIVEGRVDQYPETCQVKSPMLDSSLTPRELTP